MFVVSLEITKPDCYLDQMNIDVEIVFPFSSTIHQMAKRTCKYHSNIDDKRCMVMQF